MEQDGQGLGVGSEDDQLADAAVQGLGGLVGTLSDLAVVGGLLDEVDCASVETVSMSHPCSIPLQFRIAWSWTGAGLDLRSSCSSAASAMGQAAELSDILVVEEG